MNDDLCFLTEKESIWSGMLEDVLRQNGIAFVTKSSLGAAIATSVGHYMENIRFYVASGDLQRASELVSELFAEQ